MLGRQRWPIPKFCSFERCRECHGNGQVPKEIYLLLFLFSQVLNLYNKLPHQTDPPPPYIKIMRRTAFVRKEEQLGRFMAAG